MTPYQPYQRSPMRPQTPALRAMLLGKPQIGNHILDHQRLAAKRRKRGLYGLLQR